MRLNCSAWAKKKNKMSHKNVPIFIPHLGCPNQCVFCNQRSISGCEAFDEADVERQIREALGTVRGEDEVEIAFFGGSFTGIDRGLMLRLLDVAQKYVDAGRVSAIRLSTRPDYINGEILSILSRYAVKTVELGLQSMDDRVLRASERGHTAEQARAACRAVVAAGISLVGQMMIGLPGSDIQSEIETAEEIASLGASAARIYPTVVFYDTPLCQMAKDGEYTPLTNGEAAVRAAKVLRVLIERGVPCLRIGLCASEALTDADRVYAGPNHPALGELVWNEYYYEEIQNAIREADLLGGEALLTVRESEISKVVGQHRANVVRLERETGTRIRKVTGSAACEGISVLPYVRN